MNQEGPNIELPKHPCPKNTGPPHWSPGSGVGVGNALLVMVDDVVVVELADEVVVDEDGVDPADAALTPGTPSALNLATYVFAMA
jgi:hypothetical protein